MGGAITNETTKILPPPGTTSTQFGTTATMNNNNIIVLGPAFGGEIAVYQIGSDGATVTLLSVVVPDSGLALSSFGVTVDINDEIIAVGSADLGVSIVPISQLGAAQFTVDNVVYAPADNATGLFPDVRISNSYLVMGVPRDDNNTGAAYVYKLDGASTTPTFVQRISEGGPGAVGFFAGSIAIYDNVIIAGAPSVDKAYVYEANDTQVNYVGVYDVPYVANFTNYGRLVDVCWSKFAIVGSNFPNSGRLYIGSYTGGSTTTPGSTTAASTTAASTTSTSSEPPLFCIDLDNADFKGSDNYTPFAGQPVTQGDWQRGTLTYAPASLSRVYGYFTTVNSSNHYDYLLSNATFDDQYEYKLRFEVGRSSFNSYPSVLQVQLRGLQSRLAVASAAVTRNSFGNSQNQLTVEVAGVPDRASLIGDQITVLVAAVGAGGSSFGLTDISVCAYNIQL